MSANALTVDVTGAAANGVEVRGGTTTIGADSHISSAQGGGLVTSGSDATINFSGTAAQRNSIFSSGSYGARQRLLSTCKIPILRLIVMAVWRWVCGRSAAVE